MNGELFEAPPKLLTIWDLVRSWTGRPFLTKLLKQYGKDAVKEAALATLKEEAVEPIEFMMGALAQSGKEKVPEPWQLSESALLAEAQKRGIGTRGKTTQQLINEMR
jgi:hypothetical protein